MSPERELRIEQVPDFVRMGAKVLVAVSGGLHLSDSIALEIGKALGRIPRGRASNSRLIQFRQGLAHVVPRAFSSSRPAWLGMEYHYWAGPCSPDMISRARLPIDVL